MLWEHENYREILRQKIAEKKRENPAFSMSQIAQKLRIQTTYLSRTFRHPKAHLNEDHLDTLLQMLSFSEGEQNYLWLLRSRELTSQPDRRRRLQGRIQELRKRHLISANEKANLDKAEPELQYLSDPLQVIVHVALHLERFQREPQSLTKDLKISKKRLSKILENLERGGFVRSESSNGKSRLKPLQPSIHFGKQHPFMRSHQLLFRSMSLARLHEVDEADKHSFSVSLSAGPAMVSKVEKAFVEFIANLQTLSSSEPDECVYQLNFDFFRWI